MNDSGILRLFLDREEDAITELYDKYGAVCLRLAKSILGDPAEAEECVNDALFSVWNAIPPAEPELIGAFFLRVVRNNAINRVKRDTASKRRGVTLCLDELRECLPSPDNVEMTVETAELSEAMSRFIGKLPYEERQIFMLRYWYLRNSTEIGEQLGLAPEAVRGRLSRTRKKLKKYIEKHYERN